MYLRPDEAEFLFHVMPATLKNWADAGVIEVRFAPGGHRRYVTKDLLEVLAR